MKAFLPVVLASLLVPGCIHWDGPGAVDVDVLITREWGRTALHHQRVHVQNGSTVLDALMEVTQVELSYGGGFVQAIDGLRSRYPDESRDWFYEVDGWLADVGAAEQRLQNDDRVHWDYREWGAGEAPGLFNTFPWETTKAYVVGVDDAPEWLTPSEEPWPGAAAHWILVTSPDRAPWDLVPWVSYDEGAFEAGAHRYEREWSLVARAGPPSTTHVLVVLNGPPPPRPEFGLSWVTTPDGTFEVLP